MACPCRLGGSGSRGIRMHRHNFRNRDGCKSLALPTRLRMGYDFHQKTRTVEDISVRAQLRVCECRRKLRLRGHTGAEAAVARAFPYEAIQLEHTVNELSVRTQEQTDHCRGMEGGKDHMKDVQSDRSGVLLIWWGRLKNPVNQIILDSIFFSEPSGLH